MSSDRLLTLYIAKVNSGGYTVTDSKLKDFVLLIDLPTTTQEIYNKLTMHIEDGNDIEDIMYNIVKILTDKTEDIGKYITNYNEQSNDNPVTRLKTNSNTLTERYNKAVKELQEIRQSYNEQVKRFKKEIEFINSAPIEYQDGMDAFVQLVFLTESSNKRLLSSFKNMLEEELVESGIWADSDKTYETFFNKVYSIEKGELVSTEIEDITAEGVSLAVYELTSQDKKEPTLALISTQSKDSQQHKLLGFYLNEIYKAIDYFHTMNALEELINEYEKIFE